MMTNRISITAAAALLLAACEMLLSDDTSTTSGANTPATKASAANTPDTSTMSTTAELPESDFARNNDGNPEDNLRD